MGTILHVAVVGALPFEVLAADLSGTPSGFQTLVNNINAVITGLVGLIIALAGLAFLWGVFRFVSAAGDEKARDIGRQFIIWGLIGLTVMFAFWGLVSILVQFIGGQGTIPPLPVTPTR